MSEITKGDALRVSSSEKPKRTNGKVGQWRWEKLFLPRLINFFIIWFLTGSERW